MLRYIHACDLDRYPLLRDTMFNDRATQFFHRQGWDVTVDAAGRERDGYDDDNPLYVIWQRPDGRHGGSMRLMPTTGPVMVNDHFSHLLGGGALCRPDIWEVTRFCLAPGSGRRVAAALMLGGAEVMHGFGISHFVGVFDGAMERVYRAVGAAPVLLGASGTGRDRIAAGLWSFCAADKQALLRRAGLSEIVAGHWFRRSFGVPACAPRAA